MVLLVQPGTGADTVAVSNSNATVGNQWDTVANTGLGTTDKYSSTHAVHGFPTAQNIHYAATASTAYCAWKAALTGSPFANGYTRYYIYMTAWPTLNLRLSSLHSGASVAAGSLFLTTAGQIRTTNAAGTTLATSTATIPLNAWCRVEHEIVGISGSTGTCNGRLYSGANVEGLTADTGGTLSTAGASITGTVNEFRMSQSASTTQTSAWDIWYQDAAFSDAAMPAPVGLPRRTPPVLQAVNRAANY